MPSLKALSALATALTAGLVAAAPMPQASTVPSGSSTYWLADVDHSNDYAWEGPSDYTIFRDVTSYGAVGDGTTDDTAAINSAMSDGGRCGDLTCNSTTVTPAIIYFPPGTYLISTPIDMYYYTQMIGDPNDLPTIIASEDFSGMALIDADPYDDAGVNWFVNQDNFYRQIRNFIIDVSPWSSGLEGAGIHWQVAQATSLQNIEFKMSNVSGTAQQGIFMDNGSGGFFSDLTFTGGKYGAYLGSQQFTSRNLTFNDCETAIYMNWNWGWTLQGVTINGGTTGIDMSSSDDGAQEVGSVIIADSVITGAEYGIRFAYVDSTSDSPLTGGTLFVDNVDMSGVTTGAIVDSDYTVVVAPGTIDSWAAGRGYSGSVAGSRHEGTIEAPHKVASLLDSSTGYIFTRSKPQYEGLATDEFLTAMTNGLVGDGATDDTAAMQAFLDAASADDKVAYFEHGAYLVSDTIKVPSTIKIVGEIWPLIIANGSAAAFSDQSNPQPVWQVGLRGDNAETGAVEISDMIFEILGPAPGAIMLEWNLKSDQGESGIWDTHMRIGGSAGTNLEVTQCEANTDATTVDDSCLGVFLMFYASKTASGVYLENTWLWVADHSLDQDANTDISIYSGRGMLIEAQGPVWLWGTAVEHSILYNYHFVGVEALFSGFMQSETPYFQPNPEVPTPFAINKKYNDPPFTICSDSSSDYCAESWGLHIKDSSGVLIYGTGFYSWFQNYDEACVATGDCQQNMIHLRGSQVDMYAVTTIGAVNMIVDVGKGEVKGSANTDVYGDTMAFYRVNQMDASLAS